MQLVDFVVKKRMAVDNEITKATNAFRSERTKCGNRTCAFSFILGVYLFTATDAVVSIWENLNNCVKTVVVSRTLTPEEIEAGDKMLAAKMKG
jgi:hypothetical protein